MQKRTLLYLQAMLVVCLADLACVRLGAQQRAETVAVQTPAQLFTANQIQQLETRWQTDPGQADQILAAVRQLLDQYFTQFVADRRIQDERAWQDYRNQRWSQNQNRLQALARERRTQPGYYLGEAPYLKRLFILLGKAYESPAKNDQARANWAYSMALRYGYRVRSSDPLPLQTEAERQAAWLAMLRSFADPAHMAEMSNPEWRAAAERFQQLFGRWVANHKQCEQLQQDVYAVEARMARNQASPAERNRLQNERDQVCRQKNLDQDGLEQIRSGDYANWRRASAAQDAWLAWRLAELARVLDQKAWQARLDSNPDSFLRNNGNRIQSNHTRKRDSAAYVQFLELAQYIEPDNLQYLDLLSEFYWAAGKAEVALAWQERWMEQSQNQNAASNAERARQFARLAAIQSSLQRFVPATQALFEAIKLADNEEQKMLWQGRLADLDYRYTGNWQRAQRLYNQELVRLNGLNPGAMSANQLQIHTSRQYTIYQRLARIARQNRLDKVEQDSLQAARGIWQTMQMQQKDLLVQKTTLEQELLSLQAKLVATADAEAQSRFYQLRRRDLPAIDQDLAAWERSMQVLQYPQLLQRLAQLSFARQNFSDTRLYLREISQVGNSGEVTSARRNLDQLDKILSDGILRPMPW
ncbi:MAG: hypothetical protein KDK39_15770 [Leptospiraceae bacterium]|nr:hypothetical protein [Leptospiraceae bacterium]